MTIRLLPRHALPAVTTFVVLFTLLFSAVAPVSAQQAQAPRQLLRADGTVAPSGVAPTNVSNLSYRGGDEVFLTHSASQVITPLTGIACSSAGSTAQNSYWRVFDLDDFDLPEGLTTSSVEIGIETANIFATPPVSTVRLYTLDGAFTIANLTLVAEGDYTIQDADDATIVTVPVEGSFGGGSVVAVEWSVPNLQDSGGGVFIGANTDGQTGPTYVSAADCGLTQPTDLASIGFPDVAWVLNINGTAGGGGNLQVSLPATFDNPNVDYELTDFGGASSMIVADPEDETNNVVETLRPAPPAGECFAGTTVAEVSGFAEPIPFAPGDTEMSVRVWSPEAGVRILFKVEQVGNPGINVETFSFTTVAEAWETIVFDFANPMPNTNPIDFNAVYDKASIFFDFQCNLDPTATLPATFYWDDVAFGDGGGLDMAIHDTGDVQFEVFGFGELGSYADADGIPIGTGFVFDGDNGLYESTFLVGLSSTQVSGDAYEFPDLEWANTSPLALATPPSGYDQAFSAGYDDSAAANPIGVEVSQLSYSAEDDDYVIVEFSVENTSGAALSDVYFGVFADWDAGDFEQNLGAYDEDQQLVYVHDDSGTSTNYFGVAALNGDDGVDVSGVFYDALPGDADLYTGLTVIAPDAELPDDRRTVIGIGPYDIAAGETVVVQFAYVGGTDEANIIANAAAAQAAVAGPLEAAIHDTGSVQFEVFADGNLGTQPIGNNEFPGTGFVFDGDLGLFTSQFVVAASESQVSGSYYGTDTEWITTDELSLAAPPTDFDQAFAAAFDDSGAANPIGLDVDQYSYSADGDDYVTVSYDITNTSGADLADIYVGIFADWDVGTFEQNLGGFDEDNNLVYVYDDSGTSSNYFGVAALDGAEVSGVFYEALGGTETDDDIYFYLTTILPDPELVDDRRVTVGVGPYDIADGEEITVSFAFVGGESLEDIMANAAAAQGNPVAVEASTPDGTFVLETAYPNPFASSTTIGFTLPTTQDVKLTVYDVLGRRVATLIDGIRQAGEQTIRFDASSLPSGMYLYRLEAGGTQLTQRITLVR